MNKMVYHVTHHSTMLLSEGRRHRENIQVCKIRNEKGDIRTEADDIQKIIKSYSKN